VRRAGALALLVLLAAPAAARAQDARQRLADLLVELMDRRLQLTPRETMDALHERINALVRTMVAPDPADFYHRKLDDVAIAALRTHRPERAAEWEADARRRYVSQTRAVLRVLRQALELRHLDAAAYPTTAEGLPSLFTQGAHGGPYLAVGLPLDDAWGRPFVYRAPGAVKAYDLFSLGPDGTGGTPDDIE
jgi:type II secretion system protein G